MRRVERIEGKRRKEERRLWIPALEMLDRTKSHQIPFPQDSDFITKGFSFFHAREKRVRENAQKREREREMRGG